MTGCGGDPPDASSEGDEIRFAEPPPPTGSFRRYLPGLDEEARFVVEARARHPRKYVVRESGERQSPLSLWRDEAAARAAKFGRLTPGLHRHLETLERTETTEIVVFFPFAEPDYPEDASREALRATFNAWQERLLQHRAPLLRRLEDRGLSISRASDALPVVFAEGPPQAVRDAAELDGVSLVRRSLRGRGVTTGTCDGSEPNWSEYLKLDQFYSRSFAGSGQDIAVIERAGCKVQDDHWGLEDLSITYSAAPASCTPTGGECDTACRGELGGGDMLCRNNECVARHQSRVLSAASQFSFGAKLAHFWIPNEGMPTFPGSSNMELACKEEAMEKAYAWLADPDEGHGPNMLTVEAFNCTLKDASVNEGWVQDMYARYHDITTFKSAGNGVKLEEGQEIAQAVACPYNVNAVCVGGTKGGGGIWGSSSWENPPSSDGEESDREEPDVVARAKKVDVITPKASSIDQCHREKGNSFSTPAMASFAALMREACDIDWLPRQLRALLVQAGRLRNASGPAYSTPGLGEDYKDGGGTPSAALALRYCQQASDPDDAEVFWGDRTIDFDSSEPAPEYAQQIQPEETKGSVQPIKIPVGMRVGVVIGSVELTAGTKVRSTISWDSCPADNGFDNVASPQPLATDFDLFLCSDDTESCIVSMSADDNIEGFEEEIPETGTYDMWIMHEEGATGCGYEDPDIEDVFWVISWWSE